VNGNAATPPNNNPATAHLSDSIRSNGDLLGFLTRIGVLLLASLLPSAIERTKVTLREREIDFGCMTKPPAIVNKQKNIESTKKDSIFDFGKVLGTRRLLRFVACRRYGVCKWDCESVSWEE